MTDEPKDNSGGFLNSSSNKTLVIYLCLAGLVIFYVYHCLFWYAAAVDDAFITFRYARNLSEGLGLVFNPGVRVEGYSNFSWMLLISLAIKLGFEPLMAAKFLGALSGAGAILCSYYLYDRLYPRSFWSLLPPLLLATNSFFCYWSFAGLETVFYSFLLILACLLYLNGQSYPICAFILSLLCLSRPDGLGYLAVFLGFDIFRRIRDKQLSDRAGMWFYGVIFSVLSCYLGFKWAYFGSIFANTYYAKIVHPFQNFKFTSAYLVDFYTYSQLHLLLVPAFIGAALFLKSRAWLPLGLIIFNWFYIVYVYFDWMPNYRYHIYTMPVLFTIIALGLSEIWRMISANEKRLGLLFGALIVLGLGVHISTVMGTRNASAFRAYYVGKNPYFKKPDGWLGLVASKVKKGFRLEKKQMDYTMFIIENGTGNMTVGMRDIGIPAYFTGCRVYDRDMLIHKEARSMAAVLKSRDENSIKAYVFGPMRDHLQGYSPDLFIYPRIKYISPEISRWDLTNRMYTDYFNENMELVKEKKFGISTHAYYRQKGLTYRPSNSELVSRYEEIVRKYPRYPAFRDRLDELRITEAGE